MANYFEPPPERREPLNMRLPISLKAHLKAIVRLWQITAEAQGHDPSNIDLTFVCERLLKIGVDGVWGQASELTGIQDVPPRSEEEWDRLAKSVQKHYGKPSGKK